MELFRNRNWDIIGRTKLWFTISGVTIVAGLVALGVRGLNYGIDFTGGSLLRYQFAAPLVENESQLSQVTGTVRRVLENLNLGGSEIQIVTSDKGERNQVFIRTPPVANDEEALERDRAIVQGLQQAFPDKVPITSLGRETVGPVVGEELRTKALWAFFLGCGLIMIYITIRYEFRFAEAAIIALIHDALVVLGCMALFQVEINSAFVAALLTVIGYSNHDTVVIMDRIRENMRLRRRATFAETVNASLLETMARSVNIVLTVLFPTFALLFFGGEAIRPFSLALVFGMTTGCYSSIFTASPIVVLLERRAARARSQQLGPARAARPAGTPRPRPATAPASPAEAELAEVAEAAPSTEASSSRAVIEQLQREEMAERKQRLEAEVEAMREERRERRRREKERAAKKGGKPKRRF